VCMEAENYSTSKSTFFSANIIWYEI
jgi:hypothetical protein